MEQLLGSFEGYTRSNAQVDFHKAMIDATLPHIYGQDFSKYRERLMKERNITDLQSEVLICCPRRFGKTTSVSMFIAVTLYCCPDAWISCFSTGQRASTTLLDQAARFLMTLPGMKDRLLKKNQEQLFVRGSENKQLRFLVTSRELSSDLAGFSGVVVESLVEEGSVHSGIQTQTSPQT